MENQHKQRLLDWEVELHQELTQYEFDYDFTAWNDMGQLLDVSSIPTPKMPGNTLIISTTKLIVIISVGLLLNWLMIGLLLHNYEKSNDAPELNTPLTIEKNDEHSSIAPQQEKNTTSILKTPPVLVTEKAVNPPFIEEKIIVLQIKEEPQKERIVPSVFFLPEAEIPLLVIPKLTPDSSLMKIKTAKRKRNRKTLFPDVIEH